MVASVYMARNNSLFFVFFTDARYKFVAQFQQGSESYLLSIKSDSIENIPVVEDEERHLIIVDLNCSGTALLLGQV